MLPRTCIRMQSTASSEFMATLTFFYSVSGCQTWYLDKYLTNNLRSAQRPMERKMLNLHLQDKIPCSEIRKRTKIIDIMEHTLKSENGPDT